MVHQSSCERNFHIFHQMCAARSTCPLLKPLQLSHSCNYAYLTGGGSMAHAISRDDCSDFSRTLEAMQLMGLPSNQITEVFSLLAGILHLGNIEISSSDGEEALLHLTSRPLISCASMWGVPPAGLSRGMLQRQIATSRDHVTKCLTQREAIRCRDGFAKFLYAQLFRWLVSVLNTSLCPPDTASHFIGVLDIYGFESLEVNSFEQLLINYANEKLQLLFTEHVFRLEQEEYLREAIPWSYIPFSDNVATIQLIESHLGILDLLDETCQVCCYCCCCCLLVYLFVYLFVYRCPELQTSVGRRNCRVNTRSMESSSDPEPVRRRSVCCTTRAGRSTNPVASSRRTQTQ